MPIFEYRCRECEARFERFVSGKGRISCPQCESARVERLLSVFAVSSGSGRQPARNAGACGSCGDPRGPGACSMN